MFEEIERIQHYYHQLMQQADELEEQAFRLRRQAGEAHAAIYREPFAEGMLANAEEAARQMWQTGEMIRAQADAVKKWLDSAMLMIPPAPPLEF